MNERDTAVQIAVYLQKLQLLNRHIFSININNRKKKINVKITASNSPLQSKAFTSHGGCYSARESNRRYASGSIKGNVRSSVP